jgi:hypothetical protein
MKRKLLLLAVLFVYTTGFAQNEITGNSVPVTASVGESIKAEFTYNATVAGSCQIQMFKTDASGNIDYGAGTDLYFVSPVAAGTGLKISNTFVVPNTVMPSNTLPAGVVYKWFFKLSVAGTDYYAANPETTITAALAVNDFGKVSSKEMFVNSNSRQLMINTINVTSNSAKIYDIAGKRVSTILNLKQTQSVDLSNLKRGVFLLVTNDNRSLKFAF